MAKDHIVPQAYIRGFASSTGQSLYYFSKNPWNKKIELGTPGKICYGSEYYYLRSDISLKYNVAASHVDKELLKKYEDRMPGMFKGLVEGKEEISIENAEFISEFIVTLKVRSGYFRGKIYSGGNLSNALAKVINELIAQYPTSESDLLETKKMMEKQLAEETSPGYLHSASLLSLLRGERDELFIKLKEQILNHRWRVIDAPAETEFISSDNPGFFCNQDDTIENTNFGGNGVFTLPLSSNKALQIDFSASDLATGKTKPIAAETANKKMILAINKATYSLCEKTVYALSEKPIRDVIG